MKQRVTVLSELYYPDDSATGYVLTRIAEGLASTYEVQVLSGRGTFGTNGARLSSRETRNGVQIRRCASTSFNKNVVFLRLINLVTITLSIFWQSIRALQRGDIVLVVTNPPSLPFLAYLAARLRGARCIVLFQDVYPEVLIATGLLQSGSKLASTLRWLNRNLCQRVDRVVVLGRDMKRFVDLHLALGKNQTTIITNWADADVITPAPRSANRLLKSTGLQKKFVIQYSGNMGRTHGLEVILDAAHRLREERVFHFFLIGSGAKFRGVEAAVSRSQSGNVTLLPWQPREELADTLNACDVAIVSFIRGISGISVPSRMYNVMAAGKPLIAVADEDSEVAMVVREECIGWVVPPDDTEALVRAIKEAHSKKALLKQMGVRARQASLGYSLENVLLSYRRLFASLETGAAKSTGEREVQSRHV